MPSPEIVVAAPSDREAIVALDRQVRDKTGHPALGDAVWRDLAAPGADSVGFIARDGDRAAAYLHVARSDTFAPQHWVLGLVRDPRVTIREVLASNNRRLDEPLPEQALLFGSYYGVADSSSFDSEV